MFEENIVGKGDNPMELKEQTCDKSNMQTSINWNIILGIAVTNEKNAA